MCQILYPNNLRCVPKSLTAMNTQKMITPFFNKSVTPNIAVSSKPLELKVFRDDQNVYNDLVWGVKISKHYLVP